MPVGQELELRNLHFLLQGDQFMLPDQVIIDDLDDVKEEVFSIVHDSTCDAISNLEEEDYSAANDFTHDGSDDETKQVVSSFRGLTERFVIPGCVGSRLEEQLCFNALDNENSFERSIEDTIKILRGRFRTHISVVEPCMMALTFLTTKAPSEYLKKIGHNNILNITYNFLKVHNNLSVMRNGYHILEHIQRIIPGSISRRQCVQILYKKCRKSVPVQVIEISLEIMDLFSYDDKVPKLKQEIALKQCLRVHNFLSKKARKALLSLISKSEGFVCEKYARMIGNFLSKFLGDLPISESMENVVFRDNVVSYVRKIYGQVMNDMEAVNEMTNPHTIQHLVDLFKSKISGLCDKHTIIDILSIIAVHSEFASKMIMSSGIIKHLNNFFYKRHYLREEIPKMGIVTLIWALMPCLPKSYSYEKNDIMREQSIRPIRLSKWQRHVRQEYMLPFPPENNFFIEKAYQRGYPNEVNLIESGTVSTVRIEEMDYSNHVTRLICPIYNASSVLCDVLKLKKRKVTTAFKLPMIFIQFAFKMLSSRCFRTLYHPERFQILESYLLLFLHMNSEQHRRLWLTKCDNGPALTAEKFARLLDIVHIKDGRTNNGILARQILTLLLVKYPRFYRGVCRSYFTEVPVTDMEIIDNNWSDEESWSVPSRPNQIETTYFEDFYEEHEIEQELIFLKEYLVDTNQSDHLIRSSLAVRQLVTLLLQDRGPNPLYKKKIRQFLNIFANLPLDQHDREAKIDGTSFRILVQKLNKIMNYVHYDDTPWPSVVSSYRIYEAGIKTIKHLHIRNLRVSFENMDNEDEIHCYDVYLFTSVQYMEDYLLTKKCFRSECKNIDLIIFYNNIRIPSRMTLYEAIKRFGNVVNVFRGDHKFCFRIRKRPYTPVEYLAERIPFFHCLVKQCHFTDDPHQDDAMYLLQILYGLNKHWSYFYDHLEQEDIVESKEFLNTEIDRRVSKALLDPFQVFNRQLPAWIDDITQCPFLFSYRTKELIFRVYWLDRMCGLKAVLNEYPRFRNALLLDPRYRPALTFRRENIVNEFCVGLEFTPTFSDWLVVFKSEIANGEGVKQELFTEVGRELQKEKYNMWHKLLVSQSGYLYGSDLYPGFNKQAVNIDGESFLNSSTERKFNMLGQMMGKALVEGRMLYLPLSLPVFKWILNLESELGFSDIQYVDASLFRTLKQIKTVHDETVKVEANLELDETTRVTLMQELNAKWDDIESWELNFTLPFMDTVDLVPDGSDILLNRKNAADYLKVMKEFILELGVRTAMEALRTGFYKYITREQIGMFEPSELQMLLCGHDGDEFWNYEHMAQNVSLSSCNLRSPEVRVALEAMIALNREDRRKFLQFVTGMANLPADGFAGLNPPFSMIMSGGQPWAQTCFHTLYIHRGMTKEGMEEFIHTAITLGLNQFDLI